MIVILLVLLALGAGCLGLLFLSQATAGVGLIAFACLAAICARIAQASEQHSANHPPQPVPVDTRPPEVLNAIKRRQDHVLLALGGGLLLVAIIYYVIAQIGLDTIIGLFVG